MGTTTVTRNYQITLTKELREGLHIAEGDKIAVIVENGRGILTKRDPSVFDNFESFLSKDFEKDMKKMRPDYRKRLKRLGIVE